MNTILGLALMPDKEPRVVDPASCEASVLIAVTKKPTKHMSDSSTVCILIADAEGLGREVTSASSIGRMNKVLVWCEQHLPAWAIENPHTYVARPADCRFYYVRQLHHKPDLQDPVGWDLINWPHSQNGSKDALIQASPDFSEVVGMIEDLQPALA
jgi:hypothetical protein